MAIPIPIPIPTLLANRLYSFFLKRNLCEEMMGKDGNDGKRWEKKEKEGKRKKKKEKER